MNRAAGGLLVAVLMLPGASPSIGSGRAGAEEAAAAGRAGSRRLAAEAEALLKEDRYEEALEAAATAAELDAAYPAAHVAMAGAYYRRGDFPESEDRYRRAVELDPDDAAAHFGVGRILRTLGRYGEAAASFQRAAALAPQVPRHLRTLANHLARREDSIAMLRRYLQVVRARPAGSDPEEERLAGNAEAWLALLEALGSRTLSEMARAEPCSVPLQVAGGQPYLRMTVAGLPGQRFVFDTGATGLTVSPRIAARAKLRPIRPFTIVGTGARRVETGDLVLIDELAVGEGIVVRNVAATVTDPAGPEEGLVGPSLFSGFAVTVDLKRRRLTFGKPGGGDSGRAERFRNVGGQIVLKVHVEGVALNAMLDTGSTATILGTSALRRVPGLRTVPAAWSGGATLGIGGPLADRRVLLEGTLSLAGRDLKAGGLPTGDLSGFSRALESEVYVILGADHLDDRPFTIDYQAMTVTFAEPPSPR